jgi:tetratricopeptide (TPR) repeat protein
MNWKQQLRVLEQAKEWDMAIEFMQDFIKGNPDNMEAYIFMNYLLMNLLVEEHYDRSKDVYYEPLAKKYFDESYRKFSNNPEYLFFTGITAHMSEWYFGIEREAIDEMLDKAMLLDPNNPVYMFDHYWALFKKNNKDPEAIAYAKMVISEHSPVKKILNEKGAIGEYWLEITTHRCEEILGLRPYLP